MKPQASIRQKRQPEPVVPAVSAPDVAAPAGAALEIGRVEFKGTNALIRLPAAASVRRVLFDGVPMPPDLWRVTDAGLLRITCPPAAFDTTAHHLHIETTDDAAADIPFRSDYRHAIEHLEDTYVAGWIYDVLRPTSALTLSVTSETLDGTVRNTHPNARLGAARPEIAGGGFEIPLPPRAKAGQPEVLRIAVRGTDFLPFGPILRGATLPASVATLAQAARALGRTAGGQLVGTELLPRVIRALATSDAVGPPLEGARLLPGNNGLPRARAPSIDVIVPVYRGLVETLACLQALRDCGGSIPRRVLVIDDCSPEPGLSTAVAALAAQAGFDYHRHETNQGFVASANRGMALCVDGDVLLLNADTVVPAGFLDRLYRAAYSDPAIATVTPLSNNATICSLPLPPGTDTAPYGLTAAEIDDLARTANAGAVCDIPTAHGFCMFIKRAALDDVGLFDADTFGVGYGEENDFSLRALERGWRNVCAGDVYVGHAGSVSFSAQRLPLIAANLAIVEARYPYYHALVADFLRTDPLHTLRNRVQKAAWQRIGRIVLFVTLSLEGGAVRHVDDMMARLAGEGFLVLALATARDYEDRPMPVVRRWDSDEALRYPQPAPIGEALGDILDLPPLFIHVQHLLDLPGAVGAFVRDSGIPYAVTLHDFFYACPRVTLLDAGGGYCGMPPAAKCTACVRQGGSHPSLHPSLVADAGDGEVWRGRWGRLLRDAIQVFAPSRDTAGRYAALFPGLPVEIRPHLRSAEAPPPPPPARRAAGLRVALPGAIGPQKGAQQLIDLARHCSRWDEDVQFVVVGRTDRDDAFEDFANVSLPGSYRPNAAVAALHAADCGVALFLSIFPETYSYTLSESLEAGLVPVAYDFGAIGERLRALGVGVLVPLGAPPSEVVAALRRAATMPPPQVGRDAIWGHYGTLYADYYGPALTDLAGAMPPPDLPRLLAWPDGIEPDRWCGGEIRLQLWAARPLTRVAASFWVPPAGRFQGLEIIWNSPSGPVPLTRLFLTESTVRRVACTVPADGVRFLDLTCRFDYLFRLAPPDIRSCAAMFHSVEVAEGGGWRLAEVPDLGG